MQPLVRTNAQMHTKWRNICVDFMKYYEEHKLEEMLGLAQRGSTIDFLPLGEEGQGEIWELGRTIWAGLFECFPDISNTVHSISSDEDGVTCKVSIRGTQAQDFAGIKSKGLSFDSEHIFVFQLDPAHKIQHLQVTWDHHDFVRQLGG